MPATGDSKKQMAYRKAEDQFTRAANREAAFRTELAKSQAADAAKIARLRGLRLAKEAADKEAAEAQGANAAPEPRARAKRTVKKINISP